MRLYRQQQRLQRLRSQGNVAHADEGATNPSLATTETPDALPAVPAGRLRRAIARLRGNG